MKHEGAECVKEPSSLFMCHFWKLNVADFLPCSVSVCINHSDICQFSNHTQEAGTGMFGFVTRLMTGMWITGKESVTVL